MNCPCCHQPTLVETWTRKGVLVDVCKTCKGVWLDRGEVFLFSDRPRLLEEELAVSRTECSPSGRTCPRCEAALEEGPFLKPDLRVEQCPRCEGFWFDAGELQAAIAFDRSAFQLETEDVGFDKDKDPLTDGDHAPPDEKVQRRFQDLASGMLPLPNLFIRSAGVLFLLYAMLGLVLIALAQARVLTAGIAVAIGVGIIILQFVFGPWLMDLSLRWLYKFSWVRLDELPPHLAEFVKRVAAEQNMKVPSFGLIHDGAPNAFTYGHTPSNMRIVITQGILDLLEPAEVEGVVAHEIGHGKNWDMLLMTVVQLVPLLLYYVYQFCLRGKDKKSGYEAAIGVGAYVVYIVSEYVVLWFSRCREYYADRFAGIVTGNPNALASALVKIGYGLAARGQTPSQSEAEETAAGSKKDKKKSAPVQLDAIGAMGIFDRKSAVAMVATMAGGGTRTVALSKESIKSAMQWDLWNPWATFYELNSTHPLIAHRLQYLGDQAAVMGQEPFVLFDRRKPESYWDDFAVDLLVMLLPWLLCLMGVGLAIGLGVWNIGAAAALAGSKTLWLMIGLPLLGLGIGSLIKTRRMYASDYFAPLNVSGLLHKVKVSGVRPLPARVKGTIIGRGVPGLIWSEDFVLQDDSGILFLDYRQPLGLWNWLFGLLKGGQFAGKSVEAVGWFRRSPTPYLELKSFTVDGVTRNCYTRHARYVVGALAAVAGLVLVGMGLAG
jgi:Zn-dependent protease with chaperone function/Zn-finger nucleic acid-binding protein